MDKYSNLKSNLSLSKTCMAKGLTTYDAVHKYVKQLPYGRTSDRSDFTLVIKEGRGTCSTKHAFLKAIAIENNFENLELYLGIFKMNALNTPKIKSILQQYDLEYIPEAHCYLKINNNIVDITFPEENELTFTHTLIYEESILPEQIGDYKVELHHNYLKSWIETEKLAYNFNQIWNIRETCIRHISA